MKVDPSRIGNTVETGIFVRAKGPDGFDAHDIAHLDKESFLKFIRSRDGDGPDTGRAWREDILLLVFGHRE